jgi:crotonobetainyl-CoA:carnitine CoA-transferase CaiB-like acyl-CoA transferase
VPRSGRRSFWPTRGSRTAPRIASRYALSAEVQALFLTDDTARWLAALCEEGVPCGPINDFQ